jgi:hypothetical protein
VQGAPTRHLSVTDVGLGLRGKGASRSDSLGLWGRPLTDERPHRPRAPVRHAIGDQDGGADDRVGAEAIVRVRGAVMTKALADRFVPFRAN